LRSIQRYRCRQLRTWQTTLHWSARYVTATGHTDRGFSRFSPPLDHHTPRYQLGTRDQCAISSPEPSWSIIDCLGLTLRCC